MRSIRRCTNRDEPCNDHATEAKGECTDFVERGDFRLNLGLEARGGIEPPIKVLQTFALPLGDRASRHEAGEASCKLFSLYYFAPAAFGFEAVSFTMGEPIRL